MHYRTMFFFRQQYSLQSDHSSHFRKNVTEKYKYIFTTNIKSNLNN